jgi:hypothetical protein
MDSNRENDSIVNGSNSGGGDRSSSSINSNSTVTNERVPRGRFLYADYTPLEDDDRNVIETLKAFVSLASSLTRINTANQGLSAILDDSESLRARIISVIMQAKSSTASAIEEFEKRHPQIQESDMNSKDTLSLADSKVALMRSFDSEERDFLERQRKYKERVSSKRSRNEEEAVALLHTWLSNDYMNLPNPILTNLTVNAIVSLNPSVGRAPEKYGIRRLVSAILPDAKDNLVTRKNGDGGDANNDNDDDNNKDRPSDVLQFSYATGIDSIGLEFWNSRRKVSDLGIKEFMLPVGMKAPISEKLKQTFKFGLTDSQPIREPEFRKVDDYYIVRIELKDQKTLTLHLASDAMSPYSHLFVITYNLDDGGIFETGRSTITATAPTATTIDAAKVTPSSAPGKLQSAQKKRPRIDYKTANADGSSSESTDLLQNSEIEKMSDLSTLALLGKTILLKLSNILDDPMTILSKGKLEFLRVQRNTIAATIAGTPDRVAIDFAGLFNFLLLVAAEFHPTLRKLRERTPLKEEIIIRQELPEGKRREYAVRLDDLRSKLTDSPYGRQILEKLLGS